jgi:hypothetical protein
LAKTVVLLWGQLPGVFGKRSGLAPRPSETIAREVMEVNARIHIVGNAKLRFLPSNASAEMDAHEVPPGAPPAIVKWVELGEGPRLLSGGTYAVLVESWEGFKRLMQLAKVNPYSRFVVEFPPEVEPDFAFAAFEALRVHPQFAFRDPAFAALRGQYRPPSDVVVVGGRVYEGVDWRAVAAWKLRSPSVYGAPELGYVASGYFTPETDPYLWWARKVAAFTVVELPPPEPRERLPPLPLKRPEALPPPPARRAGRGGRGAEGSAPEAAVELAGERPGRAEGADETEGDEGDEEEGVDELETEGEL